MPLKSGNDQAVLSINLLKACGQNRQKLFEKVRKAKKFLVNYVIY